LDLYFYFFHILQFKRLEILIRNHTFFIFIISICVGSDLGGYIFGKLLGGPKLTKISPNKTYSGSIGGIICAILLGYLSVFISCLSLFNCLSHNFNLLLIIIFLSIISQIGDLIISFFKRKANLNDTGKIIPGHGGLLDRIDGMIFVFPIFYLFVINNLN
jgi:phosphatidate cytidylyltransferase